MATDEKEMLIKDVMRQPITIGDHSTLFDVLKKMIEEKTNSILVIDEEQKLIGLINAGAVISNVIPDYLEDDIIAARFTTKEIFKEEVNKARNMPVAEFMNSKPNTVKETSSITEAAILALSKKQIRVPVVDEDNKVVGLLTRTEIKRVIGNYMGINDDLK